MAYNFDDDDEFPFDINEINKIFQQLQRKLMKHLEEQGIDPSQIDLSALSNMDLGDLPGMMDFKQMSPDELKDMMQNNPNIKRMGFSISIGPDGQPKVQPLGDNPMPFGQPQQSNKSGFEEPFVDVFYSEETEQYQIIAEVQGVDHHDHVHLRVKGNDLLIHAETGPFKYKKSMLLKHPIDESTLEYTLNNGVLEITASSI